MHLLAVTCQLSSPAETTKSPYPRSGGWGPAHGLWTALLERGLQKAVPALAASALQYGLTCIPAQLVETIHLAQHQIFADSEVSH